MAEQPQVCLRPKKPTLVELLYTSGKYFVVISMISLVIEFAGKSVFGINPLYICYSVGLCCALLATYYKVHMWLNPNYRPDCGCYSPTGANQASGTSAGYSNETFTDKAMNGVLTVLDHKKANLLLGVPNSVWGILFYSGMTGLQLFGYDSVMRILNAVSCLGSLWLWYIMVTEVKSVCIICTTIHSTNFMTAFWLF